MLGPSSKENRVYKLTKAGLSLRYADYQLAFEREKDTEEHMKAENIQQVSEKT